MHALKVLALLAAVAMVCPAATLKMLSLDQMADESQTVVHGRVVSSRAEWNSTHTSIVTVYTVKAERYLKGALGATFELTELGGQVGNLAMQAPGAPHFQVGEEVVLFVWTDNVERRHQAIGFEQGVFRVRTEANGAKFVNRSVPVARSGEFVASDLTAKRPEPYRELSGFLAQVSGAITRVAQERRTGVRR